jgi:hypothetical protein
MVDKKLVLPPVDPSAFTDLAGVAAGPDFMGVIGSNPDDNAFGFLGGNDPVFHEHAGVYGQSDQQGVRGIGTTDTATGVYGGNAGAGFGVRGETKTGVAVQGKVFGDGGIAGSFIGAVHVTGKLLLNETDLQQSVADLETNVADLQQRVVALEALVNKLISFMDLTNEQPPALRPKFSPSLFGLEDNSVTALSFFPNTTLTIRITDDSGFSDTKESPFSTDQTGRLELHLAQIFSIPESKKIRIAVTDRRPNPFDWTGFHWVTPLGQAGG